MAKTSSTINDLRGLSDGQLNEKIREAKLHIQSLRGQLIIGKLKNTQDIDNQRKTIARMMTVLTEKNMLKEVENGN